MWYTATSASVNTGENIVSINSGDDLALVQESSGLIFEGESPVEVIRSYIDTGGNHKIRLASAWPYASKVNEPLIAYPTDADFAAATAELRRVLNTMEVASLTEAQEGTEDTKIMTSLKTKAAIDFNTGTAATRDVGEAAGNVMEVGAFGLGSSNFSNSQIILDDLFILRPTGFYKFSSAAANTPSNVNGMLIISSRNPDNRSMIAINDLGEVFTTTKKDGLSDFTPWVRSYHTGNILGTVSQSGGVPTGAIIESGSNANGEYTKFADGTLICNRGIITSGDGSAQTISWPTNFANGSYRVITNSNGSISLATVTTRQASKTVSNMQIATIVNGAFAPTNIDVVAIGKWY